MKQLTLLLSLFCSLFVTAQKWQSVSFPGIMVYTADTFQGKLFIGSGGWPHVYDGTTWNTVSNYSKLSVRNIDNTLYLGAKDFSTNGENIIHTYDGTTVTEKQGFRQFKYNGSRKVLDFVKAHNNIYMATNDSLFYWDMNALKWNTINKFWGLSVENIKLIRLYKNKLVVVANNELYFYDGMNWDSLGFSNMTPTDGKYMFSNVSDIAIANDTLYATGNFAKALNVAAQQYEKGNIFKYTGTSATIMDVAFDGYGMGGINKTRMGKLFVDPSNSALYVTCIKNDSIGDVYLYSHNASGWNELSLLVKKGEGYLPSFPGSEIGDYNLLFAYNNAVFVGGRFKKIAGDSIPALAKYVGTSTTGTSESITTSQRFSVYPNPVSSTLHLNLKPTNINLFDVYGKSVRLSVSDDNTIDLSELHAGIYFLELGWNGHIEQLKISKN